jgi:hypothetical protein
VSWALAVAYNREREMTMAETEYKTGDRVMKSDADAKSIPAYQDMRGTVVGFDGAGILVQWDMDKANDPSHQRPGWIKLA